MDKKENYLQQIELMVEDGIMTREEADIRINNYWECKKFEETN